MSADDETKTTEASEIPTRKKKRRVDKNRTPGPLRGPHLQRKMADNQEKRRPALALRRQGATYDQIARSMGLSTPMMAWRYVNDAIAQIPRAEAVEVKALAVAKLDAQEARLNTILQQRGGKLAVVEAVRLELALVRIAERRARLEGHDAPNRHEHTGKDGAPLAFSLADLEGMSDEQLDRVITTAFRRSAPRGGDAAEADALPGAAREARRPH